MKARLTMLALAALMLSLTGAFTMAQETERPAWVERIRDDHPRVFLNDDTWAEVRAMAEGPMAEHYARVRKTVDDLPAELEVRDYGSLAMNAAFVWKFTGDEGYLQRTREMLDRSIEFYHQSIADGKAVNWYSTTRISALAAFDWIFDEMDDDWRVQWGRSMLDHIADVQPGGVPGIERCNRSGHTTGFYGTQSLLWYAGLAMLDEGIDDQRALEYLVSGHDKYMALLEHRRGASGDDGGSASPTLGYALGAYPWAEFNFFHTCQSATGEQIAEDWPYMALFANYVMWNHLPGGHEFGYGDAPHTTNKMPASNMPQHIAQMMHFYSESRPQWVALMRYLREEYFAGGYSTTNWGCHPFLLTRMHLAPEPMDPGELPHARHFENMGQIFMRSGSGPEDTYAEFTVGGILSQHRHYDNLNFCIYHRGFLAIDSGTRITNAAQLQNYYAQTVAHNCVLIDMPDEPISNYWNGPVHVQEGGQYRQIGSTPLAFETNDAYTYVAGDATEAYRPEKCELALRQLVFVYPSHFVILDRVRSTEAQYTKRWLLHTAREPRIEGATIAADQGEGRMFCRTLLPQDAQLTAIGGPGKQFMAGGRNWPLEGDREADELMGWGRVEVASATPAAERLFLHVIQVGEQSLEAMEPVELLEGDGAVGARIEAGARTVEVTFAIEGNVAGHIRMTEGGETVLDQDLATEVQPQEGLATPGG